MYGYYTDHLYIASVDGLPEYTGNTVTSAITLYDNDLLIPGKKISVNGVEYTLNSNGVANVTLGPHDAPGDYPLVVKVNGTTVLDQTYPVAQTTYTATSSGSFTQYEQGTLTITAKRNGVAYSGAATLAGKAITFTNGKATYTTTYNTSGKQSLKLVIDGQTITLSVTVAAATYSVEAEDYTVQEYESEAVSFTVKRNGKPYQGAVTLAHNSNITSSTKSTTSNASGLVSITVTGVTAGASTISATFGGGTVSDAVSVTVTEATYTASITPKTVQRFEDAEVTITAKRNGKAYAGAITLAYSGGVSGDTKVTTNSSGTGTFTITGNTVGSGTITATYGGGSVKLSVTVAAATYSVEAEDYTVQEYESEAVSFTVKRNGKPYQGAVTLAHNSNITSSTKSTTSNASGLVSITVTGVTAGASTISATFGGGTVSDAVSVTVTEATYTASITPKTVQRFEDAEVTITAKRNGKAYAGAITLAYSGGVSGDTKVTTNSSGTGTFTITGNTVGSGTITATYGGGSVKLSATVTAATYTLAISNDEFTQYEAGSTVVTVTRNGKAYAGKGTINGTSVTFSAGKYTYKATYEDAGTETLTVKVDDWTDTADITVAAATYAINASSKTITAYEEADYTITVTRNGKAYAGAVTLAYSGGITGTPTKATSNASGQFSITLTSTGTADGTVKATFGGGSASYTVDTQAATYAAEITSAALKTNVSGTITATVKRNGKNYSGAVTVKYPTGISGTTSATATDGVVKLTATATTAGNKTLTFTFGGGSATDAVSVTASTYSFVVSPTTIRVDETKSITGTVKRNNAVYAGAVTLTYSGGLSGPASATANSSGQFTINVSADATGTGTIKATFGGGNASDTMTISAATYVASANSTSVQAYNSKSVTFTVKKNDAVYAGAVTIKYSGNLSGPASATANASGQFTISVAASGTTAGNITLTYGGGSDAIAFTVSAATYTVSASPTALTEDLASNVTFTVKRNNVAYDGAVTFSLPSGLSGSTSATATDGKCTNKLTATTTGNKTVTVSFGGGSATATFTVAAATYAASANISQLYTNDPDSVTFTVKKNNANYAGSVSLSYSSGLSGPASATASGGTFTVSLTATTTGSKTVTLSFGGGTSTVSFSVSASTYALSASPNTLAYNTATAVTFTCKRNGNPITSGVSVTSFGGLSGGTTGAKATNSAGQFTETLTSTNANGGSYTVSFTDASGNGASTTIAGEAKPEPVYKYDDGNSWTWQSTWSPDGSIGESFVILFYEGQMVAYNGGRGDTDTPTEGIDGHTYLRGELKETNDQSYTRTHKYAIARQV